MKHLTLFLILLSLSTDVSSQRDNESVEVVPLAYDRFYLLSDPQRPKQVFIVEVQNARKDLLRVVYFPFTEGFRGGITKFLDPKTLNSETLWKLRLRLPTDAENSACNSNNFLREDSNKSSINNQEPVLRFRSTQIDAEIKFVGLSEMPCMILDSKMPPEPQARS